MRIETNQCYWWTLYSLPNILHHVNVHIIPINRHIYRNKIRCNTKSSIDCNIERKQNNLILMAFARTANQSKMFERRHTEHPGECTRDVNIACTNF